MTTDRVMWDDATGLPVANPSDLNYDTVDTCDQCGEVHAGWMYHAAGATGRVCPVLFLCHKCGGTEPERQKH
jgi:hypothetical protein